MDNLDLERRKRSTFEDTTPAPLCSMRTAPPSFVATREPRKRTPSANAVKLLRRSLTRTIPKYEPQPELRRLVEISADESLQALDTIVQAAAHRLMAYAAYDRARLDALQSIVAQPRFAELDPERQLEELRTLQAAWALAPPPPR
jgi:hypothetical protein